MTPPSSSPATAPRTTPATSIPPTSRCSRPQLEALVTEIAASALCPIEAIAGECLRRQSGGGIASVPSLRSSSRGPSRSSAASTWLAYLQFPTSWFSPKNIRFWALDPPAAIQLVENNEPGFCTADLRSMGRLTGGGANRTPPITLIINRVTGIAGIWSERSKRRALSPPTSQLSSHHELSRTHAIGPGRVGLLRSYRDHVLPREHRKTHGFEGGPRCYFSTRKGTTLGYPRVGIWPSCSHFGPSPFRRNRQPAKVLCLSAAQIFREEVLDANCESRPRSGLAPQMR